MPSLYQLFVFFLIFFVGFFSTNCLDESNNPEVESDSPSILIFTKTEGFRHQSIPKGVKVVEELASENNVRTLHTEDATYFRPDSLVQFNAILFLNTTGDILNDQQQKAFQQFIRNSGGFIGIHSATDTEYDWLWYGDMVGAYFESHPQIQEATITVLDKDHPSTSFLPDEWVRTDEWYNFKDINPEVNVLMNLEESSYKGGTNGENHPLAWYQKYDGGHIFYTGGGHTTKSYSDSLFRKHLWGGIEYVLGNNDR